MRSGVLSAKYEILNTDNPDYARNIIPPNPVIMDGKFDEDEAYRIHSRIKFIFIYRW